MELNPEKIHKTLEREYGKKAHFRLIALVTYSLENLNHSKKTLFGYALKGRTAGNGFLDTLDGEVVGRNSVLLPLENLEQLKEFFQTWKVEYKIRHMIELDK